jgi:hypothetical protein
MGVPLLADHALVYPPVAGRGETRATAKPMGRRLVAASTGGGGHERGERERSEEDVTVGQRTVAATYTDFHDARRGGIVLLDAALGRCAGARRFRFASSKSPRAA